MKNKQKFHHGDYVYVKVVDLNKSHFKTNFFGIIEGSYGDLYGRKGSGGGYSVYVVDRKKDKIINQVSWYDASEIEFIQVGSEEQFKLIRKYEYNV